MQKILIYKMGKTRGVHETTPELRNRMVGMFEAGLGLRDIAAAVNCSQRTVKRWLNRFEREGTVETRERCGRKRATTSEQDEAIIKLATQTPITAAKTVLPALGLSCSVDTVRERLHKAGIHSWSPSRKHIQRMDAGGVSIHQAVWRPTGTHLGKKKSQKSSDKSTKKKPNKPIIPSTKKKKKSSSPKKKPPENEINSIDQIGNNTLPSESIKEPVLQSGLSYSPIQYNVPVNEVPSRAITINNNPQNSHHQIQYSNALELAESSMPIYHQQLNESQNWPLDLVQSNHHHHHNHYPQNSQTSVSPEPHLHELYPAPRNHNLEQSQHNNNLHENQQLHHPHHHDHHQLSDQQHHKQVSQLMNNSVSTLDGGDKIIDNNSDNCSNSNLSIDNRDSSKEDDEDEDDDEFISDDGKDDKSKKKNSKIDGNNRKKGGKAKGTLETSVEIRNRMIGMSEAGLSTLSIALAINRSERTVKRWLERWNKEGNVQTKERKGRRRITTKEQDDAIIQMATDNPLTAAKLVAPALGLNCSVDTIRERLHKAGIHSWKLGKKQGEGNAIHTVHLWQPSGNRVNKPKQITDKKKKSLVKKKREKTNEIISTSTKKYSPKKKNLETTKIQSLSTVQGPSSLPAPVNIIPEQNSMQFNHPEAVSSYVPEQNLMPRVGIPVINSLVTSTVTPPPPSIVPLDSMMQQQPRPDCRMTTSGPPSNLMPSQSTSSLAYSSCMIANNNHHPNHIDHHHHQQPDPLNYEPYMWNFPMEFSNV